MNLAHWLVRSACVSPRSPALLKGTDVIADYAAFARSAARSGNYPDYRVDHLGFRVLCSSPID